MNNFGDDFQENYSGRRQGQGQGRDGRMGSDQGSDQGNRTGSGQGPHRGGGFGTGQGPHPRGVFGQGHGQGPGYGPGCGRGWRARMEGHFRSKGFRFTVPRQIILEILEQNIEYLSADDLYIQVHERQPAIGLATVYRTLQLLVEIGVVSRIETGEGKARFKMAGDNERRRREVLICTNCFRTFPITVLPETQIKLLEQLENEVHEHNSFSVRQSVHQFYGLCRECADTSQGN